MAPLLALWLGCTAGPDAPVALAPAPGAAPPADAAPAPAAPAGPPPDIVLVVVDTLRADRTHGAARLLTPALDALAARGLRFTRAYAQSSWTLASFTSLFTGLYPHQHRVVRDATDGTRFGCLPAARTTLAESLGTAGYRTGAWVNNTFLAPEFGLQQGFSIYDFRGATNDRHRSAPDTVDAALAWLAQDATTPAFAVLHFMEPHLDYAAPPPFAGRYADPAGPGGVPVPMGAVQTGSHTPTPAEQRWLQDRYDEEVAAADAGLARLVDGLQAQGRLGRTLLVVTSDHGEEFWEHGGFEHGHALWSEVTRVPLVVAGPGIPTATVDAVVEHVDLVAALRARAGASAPAEAAGQDLLAFATTPPGLRVALSENCLYGEPCLSLVSPTERLLFNPRTQKGQVWALGPTATESTRLDAAREAESGPRLLGWLDAKRGGLAPLDAATGPQVPSFEVFEQLAALGYVREPATVAPGAAATPCGG
jgi:arylsulfatase A-like enzyme